MLAGGTTVVVVVLGARLVDEAVRWFVVREVAKREPEL
jgi:hypothetical protein